MKDFYQGDQRGQKYQAVCAKCGKTCEVPFKPTGDRPIYCQTCFEKRGRGAGQEKKKYQAVCAKCGKRCEVPFRPSGDKPVYCQECFSQGGKSSGTGDKGQGGQPVKGQFEVINSKLDRILTALSQGGLAPAAPKKIAGIKKPKAAPAKKAKPAVKKQGRKKG